MRKRQIKKRTKKQQRNAEVQAVINAAINATKNSYLNCIDEQNQKIAENLAYIERIQKEQNHHSETLLKNFAAVKEVHNGTVVRILEKQDNHHKLTWKNMMDAINRANQREKELNYMIFGYVVLTIATIIIMLTH